MKLKGHENIFEAGCGSGQTLLNLRRSGHHGKLMGLDINRNMFKAAQDDFVREDLSPIEFLTGSADNLPFANDSLDVMLAFFMLYHMPDIDKTLLEWKRVLRPKGKILVATASGDNKPKHKMFKKLIESFIGESTPPQFSQIFNLENAEDYLNRYFKVIDRFVYQGEIRIKDPQPYLQSLDSVRDMFEPMPPLSRWNEAKEVIGMKISNEIEKNGFYADAVKRGFFICQTI